MKVGIINSASQIPQEGWTLNSRRYRPREDIAREVVLKPGLPGQGKAGEFKEEQHSRQEPLDKGMKLLERQFEPSIPRSLCSQHPWAVHCQHWDL